MASNWTSVVTNGGKSLFATWLEGTTLNFGSAEAGTGTVAEAALMAQTALINKRQDVSLLWGKKTEDGVNLLIQIQAADMAYTLNQIGIYASLDGGPATMVGILQNPVGISIPDRASTPDFIYKHFALIEMSNTGTFTVTVDTSALVAQSTLDDAVAMLEADATAKADAARQAAITTAAADATAKANTAQADAITTAAADATAKANTAQTNAITTAAADATAKADTARQAAIAAAAADATAKANTAQTNAIAAAAADATAKANTAQATAITTAAADATAKANTAQATAITTAAADATAKANTAQTNAIAASRLFVLSLSFGSMLVGKSFTVAGGGFSASGTVPSALFASVAVPHANTTYTITCDGVTATVATGASTGIYQATLVKSFAASTWAEIAQITASGIIPESWQIGDEKNITLTTGEVLTMQIYGKKHDDLADGSGKAGLTLGMKNLMATTRRIHAAENNSFTGSEMFAWLSGELFESLPDDLKVIIKTVSKKTSAGNLSTEIKAEAMKLFLFAEVECFGTATYSVAGEGTQYPIFTNNASRIKYLSNGIGSASFWWERSPRASVASRFCLVDNYGIASNIQYATTTALGVCFGFCV